MKNLLGEFNSKVGREDIFKPTIGDESLHERVKLVNFAKSKNLRVKCTMVPHGNIHKFIWASLSGNNQTQILRIVVDRRRHLSVYVLDRSGQQILLVPLSFGGKS
jgi:hypothetical protein